MTTTEAIVRYRIYAGMDGAKALAGSFASLADAECVAETLADAGMTTEIRKATLTLTTTVEEFVK